MNNLAGLFSKIHKILNPFDLNYRRGKPDE